MRRLRRTVLMALAAVAFSCSGQQSASSYVWTDVDEASGQRMNLSQGAMPTGQTFTGVYRSPQIGDIEMVQTGDALVGRYEYDRGSCHVRARIEGNVTGNLLRFNWREDHRECGRIQPVTGRGFFLYHLEDSGEGVHRGRLFGRWGYQNDDHTGGPWTAFKQNGRNPTMNPDGSAGGGGGGEGSGGGAGGSGGSGGGSGGGEGSGGAGGGSGGSGGGDPLRGI